MISIAISLPIAIALIVGFEYFSIPAGSERKLSFAISRAFPIELYRPNMSKIDYFSVVINQFVLGPFVVKFISRIFFPIASGSAGFFLLTKLFGPAPIHISSNLWIIVIQVVTIYISTDFALFTQHYLAHRVPILWADHKVHHSAEFLTFMTGYGRAPVLPTPNIVIYPLITFIINMPVIGLMLYFTSSPEPLPIVTKIIISLLIFSMLFTWLGHTKSRISLGPLNYIFNAPVLHHVHHSAELHHRDKNFAIVFSIFDWMFGTLYIPSKDEVWRTGLGHGELGPNNPHSSIRGLALEPYRYWWAALRMSIKEKNLFVAEQMDKVTRGEHRIGAIDDNPLQPPTASCAAQSTACS